MYGASVLLPMMLLYSWFSSTTTMTWGDDVAAALGAAVAKLAGPATPNTRAPATRTVVSERPPSRDRIIV